MDFLPGVPLAHPVPSLAFAPDVEGFQPSPVQDEVWNTHLASGLQAASRTARSRLV